MYIIGRSLEEDEFFNLVVKDENFTDFVKKILQSDNKIFEDKLSNLESLKNDVGVSYKSSKMKLFVGADNEWDFYSKTWHKETFTNRG